MNELQSQQLMTKEVTCVHPETEITEVIRRMHAYRHSCLVVTRSKKIRHLPDVNPKGEIVGLLTQTDLVRSHFMMIEKIGNW